MGIPVARHTGLGLSEPVATVAESSDALADDLANAFDNLSDTQRRRALYYLTGYDRDAAQTVYSYAKSMPR